MTPEDAARAAWAEDAHEIIPTDKEIANMKPQPDMAQMAFDDAPFGWREMGRASLEAVVLALFAAGVIGAALAYCGG